MNKSIVEIIKILNSPYRKLLIMNKNAYEELKRELGMEYYEELVKYKNLTIAISLDDNLKILLV
jgi:hypothetical protein